MDLEKIVQDLNRKFAEPLLPFYKRRLVFWHDEDKEFVDQIATLSLENAKIISLNGHNSFAVKQILNIEDTENNYLVYVPFGYSNDEENWLLDMELYSDSFRADILSMWMDEMGLPSTPELRKTVKRYQKFLNAKDRRNKIVAQSIVPQKAAQFHLAVMGAICSLKKPVPNDILKVVLFAGLDNSTNSIYGSFKNYEADSIFWELAKRGTGYSEDELDLRRMCVHIMLTALTRTISIDALHGLENFISEQHQAFCYDLVSEWIKDPETSGSMYEIARDIEQKVSLSKLFKKLQCNDLWDTEIFPCTHEVVLEKLMEDINNSIINVDLISKTIENRKLCAWYDKYVHFYEALEQVANMQEFRKNHGIGFHGAFAKEIWDSYVKDYYKMDSYYRSFHSHYAEMIKEYNPVLQDLATGVKDYVENLYNNWFLAELGANWSNVCAQELKDFGKVLEIPEQANFYSSKIANKENKLFVIISDALRYEVAVSLSEQLRSETKCEVNLGSMQALFPTITPFGMAALLPHKKLTAETKGDRLVVLADGMSTESNNREKVLQQYVVHSTALQAKNLLDMKRDERTQLVRDKKVVYIYHDKIDQAGHVDEKGVFLACDSAIKEIKNLIRIIVNDFGSTNIIVTADHGFIYTYAPLKEDSKVDKTKNTELDIEHGRRYAIMKQGANEPNLIPVKFIGEENGLVAFAPRVNIRIKMTGAGLNYVHGGISLQEMVVPVLEYHFLRNASAEYKNNRGKYDNKPVTIELLTHTHKVSNLNFSLNFYQKDVVGGNLQPANYLLYFTDAEGSKISEPIKLVADKTSRDAQERTFRAAFNLKAQKYKSTDTYYLVMVNDSDGSVSRVEYQIDLAYGSDEFEFFS